MAEQESQMYCPVCKRVRMEEVRPSEDSELKLDYCDRCGGMWFDSGEVRQLRFWPPEVLSSRITMKKQLFSVKCPSCKQPMTRNSAQCKSCGHDNVIDCPSCGDQLERVQSEAFAVDVCRSCRGAWFDNIDLSQVWNLQFKDRGAEVDPESNGDGVRDDSEDTVVAILRSGDSAAGDAQAGSGNVFGTIANIIGGILSPGE